MNITPEQIWALDKKYAEEGVAFHARPLRAAIDIVGNGFCIGPPGFTNPDVEVVCRMYEKLIPETVTQWPGRGTGIAASVDQVKKFTIGVAFGTVNITVERALGFESKQDWERWCRNDPEIANKCGQSFMDAYEFAYGVQVLGRKSNERSIAWWHQAQSNLEVIADSLSSCYRTNSVLQPICMLAELSMKGTLHHFGVSEADLRNTKIYGHQHIALATKMAELSQSKEDPVVLSLVNTLPNYVKNRYDDSGMTRLQIVELALGAQFIAASAMRRLVEEPILKQVNNPRN